MTTEPICKDRVQTDRDLSYRSNIMQPSELLAAIDEAERGPLQGALDTAPVLTRWWLIVDGHFIRAAGEVTGHPTISQPFLTTSPVLALDDEAGWMRTRSRWYKLGVPDDPDNHALLRDAVRLALAAFRAALRKSYDRSN